MEYNRILDEAFLFTMTEFEELSKLRIQQSWLSDMVKEKK
jgi:adenosine deaminase